MVRFRRTAAAPRIFDGRHRPRRGDLCVAAIQGIPDSDLDRRHRTRGFRGDRGGARVVGFDAVFASSIEDSQIRFGADALVAKLRGFDRDYLRALASGGRAGKIVFGETESRGQSISRRPDRDWRSEVAPICAR